MAGFEMRFNGRRITSGAQLERELKRSMEKHVEGSLRKLAEPGMRMKKTREGYAFEGTPEQVARLTKRLR